MIVKLWVTPSSEVGWTLTVRWGAVPFCAVHTQVMDATTITTVKIGAWFF